MRRELATLPPPDPRREAATPEERERQERHRQLLRQLAEIEKRVNEENAGPRRRYISPATREAVYALYYDQLRRRIEDRGTRDFPEHNGQKLYGELTMNVTVDASGRVVASRGRAAFGVAPARPARAGHRLRRGALRPLQHADAAAGRPDRHHLALPLHARRRAGNHLEQPMNAPAPDAAANAAADPATSPAPAPAPAPARYAVLGNPVAHSRSPFIHAAFARQTGQALAYERLLCPLDGFAAAVRAFADGDGRGCNVTVPFKFEAPALAAQVTPRAALAHAANTLRFDAEGWLADNTDGVGLVRDIEQGAGVALAGRRVLLVGAGGAAAGVLGPLLEARPAELVLANRTLTRPRRWCTGTSAGRCASTWR
jgi:hypothetical protein